MAGATNLCVQSNISQNFEIYDFLTATQLIPREKTETPVYAITNNSILELHHLIGLVLKIS